MNEYFKPLKSLPGILITAIGVIGGFLTINLVIEDKIKDKNLETAFIISCWIILIFFLISLIYIIGYIRKVNDDENKFDIIEVIDGKKIILKNNENIGIYDFVKFIQIKTYNNETIGYGYCEDIEKYTQITPLCATQGNEEKYKKLLQNDADTKANTRIQKKITKEDYKLLKLIFQPTQGGN